MKYTDFTIIFKKLQQASDADSVAGKETPTLDFTFDELDEINELRRLALEVSEPESSSYTST